MANLLVYAASSESVDKTYFDAAFALGRQIALHGDTLVFGAGTLGLMGACARGVHSEGGRVVGVIPEFMNEEGIVYPRCDEMIVTPDMRTRKAEMERRADAFIALPGGWGTLEEIAEVLVLKQLRRHTKPILFLNANGFYAPLVEWFRTMSDTGFAKAQIHQLYHLAADPESVYAYLANYTPPVITDKWLTDTELKPHDHK